MITRENIEDFGLSTENTLDIALKSELDEPVKTQFCAELRLRILVRKARTDAIFLMPLHVRDLINAIGDVAIAWRIIAEEAHSKQYATGLTNYTPTEM